MCRTPARYSCTRSVAVYFLAFLYPLPCLSSLTIRDMRERLEKQQQTAPGREIRTLFVSLGFDCCLQCLDGLVHWLGRDMDHSSETLLQFEDHSNCARYS